MLHGIGKDSAIDNIDEKYDRLVEHLNDRSRKAESFETIKRRQSLDALELISGASRAVDNQELAIRAHNTLQRGNKRRP
ncbi:hypothetical protein RB195_022922 [Necator americanus]|uniref:Uncharacterized protein n=1 Tax=Necator americanus TaxID=51031 RepID=A0ABR1EHC6_NECAM